MKKIRALVMVLLATVALGFMGCTSTYTGTVKVKIFNSADVPLTDCLCTSGSSVVYPYAGYINGTSVTIYTIGTAKQRTSEYQFGHPSLELKSSNPGTITVVYNFVKTTDGDYVLCKVE